MKGTPQHAHPQRRFIFLQPLELILLSCPLRGRGLFAGVSLSFIVFIVRMAEENNSNILAHPFDGDITSADYCIYLLSDGGAFDDLT